MFEVLLARKKLSTIFTACLRRSVKFHLPDLVFFRNAANYEYTCVSGREIFSSHLLLFAMEHQEAIKLFSCVLCSCDDLRMEKERNVEINFEELDLFSL